MEKQTRVSKYKELREEMKEEVAINQQTSDTHVDEDDDFLAFLPKEEEKKIDDTLMEPLSYETLNHDNEDVLNALNEAKVNVGKEKYNTRLDILNKIKQDNPDYIPAHGYKQETKEMTQLNQSDKKMSLLERLAAMSPEEDAEELKKYEEEVTVEELMKKEKKRTSRQEKEKVEVKPQPVVHEKKVEVVEPIEEDDEEEGNGKLVTILNYVIVVFMIVFIALVVLIVKQLLF